MATAIPVSRQLGDAMAAGDAETFGRLMAAYPEHVWDDPARRTRTRWLFQAVSQGYLPLVELLVAAGADINAPESDHSGGSPEGVTDTASSEGHVELVQWLMDRGAVVNYIVNGTPRCFALSSAAFRGQLATVRLLVERGAWMNCVWAGMTPLSHAMMYGETAVAEYLRSVGGKLPEELDG